MIQKLKLPKHLKFTPYFKTSIKNIGKAPTTNYVGIWAAARFLPAKTFLLEVIEIRPNTKKRLAAKLLILLISQTFLRCSNTDFVDKVTKAICLLIFLCTS